MDIGDESCDRFQDKNHGLKQTISLREILKGIKSSESNIDLESCEKCIEILIQDEIFVTHEDAEVLNDCIQFMTECIFNLPAGSVSKQITFRKFLFLVSLKKRNILKEENLETNDICLSIVSNGCELVKLCIDNDNLIKVEYYIHQILNVLDNLDNFYTKRNPYLRCVLLHKRIFLNMCRIEKMVKEDKFLETLQELQMQKLAVIESETYRDYFICLCYNFSLKCKQKEYYDCAITSLVLVYEVYQQTGNSSKYSKKILQFLVHLCLEYGENQNWECVVNALHLAYQSDIDMFYVMSKLKISVSSKQQSYLEEVLDQATEWRCISTENVDEIVSFLLKYDLSSKAAEFVRRMRYKPFSSNDEFLLIKTEIRICMFENNRRVFNLLENAIDMTKNREISMSSIRSLCKLLLSYAGIKFKEKMFKDSLVWYDYCAQLCETDSSEKSLLHHVQIRKCLCYKEMNEWSLAKEVFSQLKWNSFHTDSLFLYLALHVAFMNSDEKLVDEVLKKQGCDDENIKKILISCCHEALSSDKKDFAFKVLEALCMKSDRAVDGIFLAKISQYLICLCRESSDDKDILDRCLTYMDKTLYVLQNSPENQETAEISQWFSRAAWNLALTPNIESKHMFEFFLRCCCFSEISMKNLTRLKNSLMLAAAAGLRVIREFNSNSSNGELDRNNILGKILTVIEKCKTLETGANITLLRLLCLYEFEVKCHMAKGNDGNQNMKEVFYLPFMDVKTLEHLAAIAYEFMPNNYRIIIEALKVAIQKMNEIPNRNSSESSQTYHSLVQMMFYAQEYFSPSVEEENLSLCGSLLKLIGDNAFEAYPQLEILWLMTKCWNWGIQKLTLKDSKRAYKWCTLAMGFLTKLDSLKTLHEKRLLDMYTAYFPEFRNGEAN